MIHFCHAGGYVVVFFCLIEWPLEGMQQRILFAIDV
jgi:hypothetical protein